MRQSAKLMETVLLTRQLADLTHGGLPLTRGLDIVRRQTRNAEIKTVLNAFRNCWNRD